MCVCKGREEGVARCVPPAMGSSLVRASSRPAAALLHRPSSPFGDATVTMPLVRRGMALPEPCAAGVALAVGSGRISCEGSYGPAGGGAGAGSPG